MDAVNQPAERTGQYGPSALAVDDIPAGYLELYLAAGKR
jgi:hypothetical protein